MKAHALSRAEGPALSRAEGAADKIRLWREKPQVFVREVLGVTPDAWQDEVLAAFPHRQRLAMKMVNGTLQKCAARLRCGACRAITTSRTAIARGANSTLQDDSFRRINAPRRNTSGFIGIVSAR